MTINEALEMLQAKYKQLIEDGTLSWDDVVKLSIYAVMLVVRVLETQKEMPGEEKKRRAMEFLLSLFDSLMLVVDLPGVPKFFQALVKSMLREMVSQLASPVIDALVAWWNHYGWGDIGQLPDYSGTLDVKALL
jgi:hypothetical protein